MSVWSRRVPIYRPARLGIWIVVLGQVLLLRARFHLVCISFRRGKAIRVSCRGATFEICELLHPCREWTTAALTVRTIWHFGQLLGIRFSQSWWDAWQGRLDSKSISDKNIEGKAQTRTGHVPTMGLLRCLGCRHCSSGQRGAADGTDRDGANSDGAWGGDGERERSQTNVRRLTRCGCGEMELSCAAAMIWWIGFCCLTRQPRLA
jgi:hypothetical protein